MGSPAEASRRFERGGRARPLYTSRARSRHVGRHEPPGARSSHMATIAALTSHHVTATVTAQYDESLKWHVLCLYPKVSRSRMPEVGSRSSSPAKRVNEIP